MKYINSESGSEMTLFGRYLRKIVGLVIDEKEDLHGFICARCGFRTWNKNLLKKHEEDHILPGV